ncbi:MAG: patatin-like phospholipase family protein [Sumerlaeia bacterium]
MVEGTESKKNPPSLALCLSGGGLRSAVFHLGVLRRLNEVGLLAKIDMINASSGGSLIAAVMAHHLAAWPSEALPVKEFDDRVVVPMRNLAGMNLYREAQKDLPRQRTLCDGLAHRLAQHLAPQDLMDLPLAPRFTFLATDVSRGCLWEFRRDRMGCAGSGWFPHSRDDGAVIHGTSRTAMPRAVAASCCHPTQFRPMTIPFEPGELVCEESESGGVSEHRAVLSDGGLADPLAIEPALTAGAKVIIAIHGGSPFQRRTKSSRTREVDLCSQVLYNQLLKRRYQDLMGSGSRVLYLPLSAVPAGVPGQNGHKPRGYTESFAEEIISQIPADLSGLTYAESAVLENHGYTLAEPVLKHHATELPAMKYAPLTIPYPDFLNRDESSLARAVATS